MRRWLPIAVLAGALALPGLATAEESTVGCGEACDTEMKQCLAKCPPPPAGQSEDAPYDIQCQNDCAKKVFHPCLDKCKRFPHEAPPNSDTKQ